MRRETGRVLTRPVCVGHRKASNGTSIVVDRVARGAATTRLRDTLGGVDAERCRRRGVTSDVGRRGPNSVGAGPEAVGVKRELRIELAAIARTGVLDLCVVLRWVVVDVKVDSGDATPGRRRRSVHGRNI